MCIRDSVFPSSGNGYGVSPSPDKTYTIKFRYYQTHTDLNLFSDQTLVPTSHDAVIVDGALFYMYLFKDTWKLHKYLLDLFNKE